MRHKDFLMKKNRLITFSLAFLIALTAGFSACSGKQDNVSEESHKTEQQHRTAFIDAIGELKAIDNYGGIALDITVGQLFEAGFQYADIATVEIADKKIEIPVVPNYRYLPAGNAGIICFEDKSSKVILASFYRDFSTSHGIATKTVNPDKSFFWTPQEGVNFPLKIRITLSKPNGYAEEYEVYNLRRSTERQDYPDKSDEEFGNFREITTTGVRPGTIYRASSPISPEIGRNKYVDAAAAKAKIRLFLNMSDSKENGEKYPGYADTYYSTQKIAWLHLNSDLTSESFSKGYAEGLRSIIKNDTPVLLHCIEGQDRTGFGIAVLEAFTGATYDEIIEDYMKTYENYYGVKKNTRQYEILSQNIIKNIKNALSVENPENADLKKAAEDYFARLGLSADEINSLKIKLRK